MILDLTSRGSTCKFGREWQGKTDRSFSRMTDVPVLLQLLLFILLFFLLFSKES
jgi:hypothetical protein